MKTKYIAILASLTATGLGMAQTAYTTPVGYVSQTALASSDTIVSLPLEVATAFAGALSVSPDTTTTPGSAILTVTGTPFVLNAFQNTHYLKFTSGSANGKFYAITSNTTSAIVIDLNGDTLSAVSTNTFSVNKFWTLGELFLPSATTTSAATTGNAIVASTSGIPAGRRTEILLPDNVTAGTNLARSGTFFIFNNAWRRVGQPITTSFDSTQLWPDNDFVIRHPAAVTGPTTYTISGEVETGNFGVGFTTRNASRQDNFVGIHRPIDVSLNGLALGGTSAFLTSISGIPAGRRDELLVFDNAVAARNKAASATYFYFNSAWRRAGSPVTTDFGTDVIRAGAGFIVRKFQVSGGPTQFWNNTPTY